MGLLFKKHMSTLRASKGNGFRPGINPVQASFCVVGSFDGYTYMTVDNRLFIATITGDYEPHI